MSRLALQLVGGTLYLLNKMFLDSMERARLRSERMFWLWRKLAWAVYLLGLPPIVAIFFRERNWLFGSIELGGAPSMLCGLIAAFAAKKAPAWLDRIALAAIPIGLGLSLYDFGGLRTFNQGLEVAGSAGFLIGTYLLAKDDERGYWWFMLMNLSTGWLLYREGYPLFVPQQALSVVFIVDAYRVRRRNNMLIAQTVVAC